MPPTEIKQVKEILTDLAACLINQLIADSAAMPCAVGVIPGEGMIPEYQGPCMTYTTTILNEDDEEVEVDVPHETCGRGWVRMGQAYPASGVGALNATPGNCGADLGFDVNMGISRCYNPSDARTGPTAVYLEEVTTQVLDDMMTMKRAIQCCTTLDAKDYILGPYLPFGPLGAMIGGSWSIQMIR